MVRKHGARNLPLHAQRLMTGWTASRDGAGDGAVPVHVDEREVFV